MARGKAISVKIKKEKVINALEVKLSKVKSDKANEKITQEKFEQAQEKWQKEVIKIATAKFAKAQNVRVNVRYNGLVNVDFDLPNDIGIPEEPKKEGEVLNDWQYKDMVEEIENAIRILKMSEEELINTSTYNSIARYL